jgi:transglutaminase-like putative cysteine protease
MLIRLGYEVVFDIPAPTPMLLLLFTHPERASDLRRPERLCIEPAVPVEQFIDRFGNRCGRLLAPAGPLRLTYDNVIHECGQPDLVCPDAAQVPVDALPTDVLPFLMASRYCEVDTLSDTAWKLFGSIAPGWARVQAVCDWVHEHIAFGYQHARSSKSAADVFAEGAGVCRDFTHLAITFCRCLNIPARYATGYLGDIGVPVAPFPMDFSAWFEAYLGGRWYTFDARHNMPRIGRVVMARGRDAVDTALTTSFGPTRLDLFKVWTDEITEPQAVVAG